MELIILLHFYYYGEEYRLYISLGKYGALLSLENSYRNVLWDNRTDYYDYKEHCRWVMNAYRQTPKPNIPF